MIFSKKKKTSPPELDKTKIPRHIAVIMDGNGRWAQRRGLPRTAGHAAGSDMFNRAVDHCALLGVEYFTIYAFSTENWNRPEEEVGAIMSLLDKNLRRSILEMRQKNMGLYFWGDVTPLSDQLKALIRETDALSTELTGMRVNVCLNYGGRNEIARAARLLAEACAAGEMNPEQIDETMLEQYLWSAGTPAPDLVIRTGEEKRMSNFLLWQSAYSEYYFSDVLWPDFDEAEIDKAIRDFQGRKRRYGGIVNR